MNTSLTQLIDFISRSSNLEETSEMRIKQEKKLNCNVVAPKHACVEVCKGTVSVQSYLLFACTLDFNAVI